MQTHQSQTRLARLIEQEMIRINHQQQGSTSQCQELIEKTSDLMNAVCHHVLLLFLLIENSSLSFQSTTDSSRTKTYLIGELQKLPLENCNK